MKVTLATGIADAVLTPGNKLSMRDFRSAVLNDGYVPKEAQIEARGEAERQGKTEVLIISGTPMHPQLAGPGPLISEALRLKHVRVRGTLDSKDTVLTLADMGPARSAR